MIRDTQFGRFVDEPFEWLHPVDDIEPQQKPFDQLRDARLMTVHLLNDFAVEMLAALSDGSDHPVQHGLTKLYGIAYAMGLSICDGASMSETADRLAVERATISKVATAWNVSHDLKPSWHCKSTLANEHYATARRQVVQSNGSNGHKPLPVPPSKGRSV